MAASWAQENEAAIAAEVRNARMRLQTQPSGLGAAELDRLAETLGRSNYLARTIPQAIQRHDFTNAERMLREFPGKVDDLNLGSQRLLYHAVTAGMPDDTARVDFLLEHGADPNKPEATGDPLLLTAVRFQRYRAAVRLLEAGALPNATNASGQSPLEDLIGRPLFWMGTPTNEPSFLLLLKLLEKGADAFAPAGRNRETSVLEQCSEHLNGGEVRGMLLTNRPGVARRTPRGDTALHLAAAWGLTNVIDCLVKAGFSIDQTNTDGLTPLQRIADSVPLNPRLPRQMIIAPARGPAFGPLASRSPVEDTVDFLLSRGAALDVFSAAGLGRTNELAAMLRAQPGLAGARDGQGRTPLHYAAGSLQTRTARLLILSRADVSAATFKPVSRVRLEGQSPAATTPLHVAAGRGGDEMVDLLLRAGAKAAAADADGNTPLHLAAKNWQTNCLASLIAAHVPLDATNSAGQTALRAAAEAGIAPNVELLLKSGAQVSAGMKGETLLHIAAERGAVDVLKVLLDHKLALEARDAAGRTAFQRAVMARQWSALAFLRSMKADINAADSEGNTALHLASTEQGDLLFHLTDQSLWERWKMDWLSRPGARQQALSRLIQWKVVTAPVGPTSTNSSLTAWLLQHGAAPNLTNHLGQTPLHVLIAQSWLRYDPAEGRNRVAMLLEAGTRVEALDAQGLTCLHIAATNSSPAILALLLQHTPHPEALRDGEGRTPLHYAAACVNPWGPDNAGAQVAALLAGGLNPDVTDRRGRTPLHEAVIWRENGWWHQREVALVLLTNKANPNLQDLAGLAPLHLAAREWLANGAAQKGAYESMKLLLTNGAEPNLRDSEGRTPLHWLAANTNEHFFYDNRLAEILQKGGWDYAARDNAGQTPLHLLAEKLDGGWSAWLRDLLTNKTLLNLTNAVGDTPLHIAIRSEKEAVAKALLEAGADAALRNHQGDSAWRLAAAAKPGGMIAQWIKPGGANWGFFAAIRMGDGNSFDRWIAADAAVCLVTNRESQTPLLVATERKQTLDLAERLLALGAPLDTLSALRLGRMEEFERLLPSAGRTIPSPWLFEAVRWHRLEGLRSLVRAGGDIRALDAENHSLLYRAQEEKQLEITEWLNTSGCRETVFDAVAQGELSKVESFLSEGSVTVNATNRQGRTLLWVAAAAGKPAIVEFLLGRGAKVDSRTSEGWTALHMAAAGNEVEIAGLLLRAGASPNELAQDGMGPLHIAAVFGRLEVAELLLQKGADVNLRTEARMGSFGNTPLHWAVHRGGAAMVKLLLDHGADTRATNKAGETPAGMIALANRGLWKGFATPAEIASRGFHVLSQAELEEIRKVLEAANGAEGVKR
jgi:ankyrin repeat protein